MHPQCSGSTPLPAVQNSSFACSGMRHPRPCLICNVFSVCCMKARALHCRVSAVSYMQQRQTCTLPDPCAALKRHRHVHRPPRPPPPAQHARARAARRAPQRDEHDRPRVAVAAFNISLHCRARPVLQRPRPVPGAPAVPRVAARVHALHAAREICTHRLHRIERGLGFRVQGLGRQKSFFLFYILALSKFSAPQTAPKVCPVPSSPASAPRTRCSSTACGTSTTTGAACSS